MQETDWLYRLLQIYTVCWTYLIGNCDSTGLVNKHILFCCRDVIIVDQNEYDLKNDLDVVRKRVDGFYKASIWIGITGKFVW